MLRIFYCNPQGVAHGLSAFSAIQTYTCPISDGRYLDTMAINSFALGLLFGTIQEHCGLASSIGANLAWRLSLFLPVLASECQGIPTPELFLAQSLDFQEIIANLFTSVTV